MSWMCLYGIKRAQKKRLIQQWLDEAGLNQRKIAELAGVSSQCVSQTLNGAMHSPKVLGALREVGVSENLLFDPRKIPTETSMASKQVSNG